jgi:hypothetical protein
MFDPAALGTLIIGLEAIPLDEEHSSAVPHPVRAKARGRRARRRLAETLRGMAARIEPAGLLAR